MNYIFTKEQYLSAKSAWNNIASRTPADHIIYNAIRGFDLKRGFTEITNPIKLSNGAFSWHGFHKSRVEAQRIFKGPFIWPKDQARFDQAYSEQRKNLSKRYGIEFTTELMEAMREVLK